MSVDYEYHNLPIGGGGYVTGLSFARETENILFARTDIGGVYRYDFEGKCWVSLADSFGVDELELTFPFAIAIKEEDGKTPALFEACGHSGKDSGLIAVTPDLGDSYYGYAVPVNLHGNLPGRGSGNRMTFDREGRLLLASFSGGLWVSEDFGVSWEHLPINNFRDFNDEKCMSFVWCGGENNSEAVVIGCSGSANAVQKDDVIGRGSTLYLSSNGGSSFQPLPVPDYPEGDDLGEIRGYVAYRCASVPSGNGEDLYVTLQGVSREGMAGMDSFGSDCGNSIEAAICCGRVVRYHFEKSHLVKWEDVTPDAKTFKEILPKSKGLFGTHVTEKLREERYPFGFSGIDCCRRAEAEGTLLALSISDSVYGSVILRSTDSGKNWEIVLNGLEIGKMEFRTPYLNPEYNDGASPVHWVNDIKINPFRPDEVWFVTGTGVFATDDFGAQTVCWHDVTEGMEETVHLNVYSLPVKQKPGMVLGDTGINVVDAVGDLGGLVFKRWNEACERTIADENGHRYITSMNADYSDEKPDYIAMTPRGNWSGTSKGSVAVSSDGGKHFRSLPYPFGISQGADALLDQIARPNVNSGWVAVGAKEAEVLIWQLANGRNLPLDAIFRTEDEGETWTQVKVHHLPKMKNMRAEGANRIKIMADRVNPQYFYGFGDHFRIYISPDAGKNFYEYPIPEELPFIECGMVEGTGCEIRGQSGATGVFWIAAGKNGLWRMEHDRARDVLMFECLSIPGEEIYTFGMGIGRDVNPRQYLSGPKTFYMTGKLNSAARERAGAMGIRANDDFAASLAMAAAPEDETEYGFWRSEDEGRTWVRINDEDQYFGQIRSVDGDDRIFGRFFLGTGTRGLLMGQEKREKQ